ncbi:MAG: heavy-metal-associated domain-containing protein [Prosthecobacter sp.]
MKNLLLLVSILFSLAATLPAADEKPFTYLVEMSGMVCAGCKDHVTASFKKLEGVTDVKIVAGDKPGTQKVTVTSTSPSLSKDQAVTALGSSAETYLVHNWKKSE